MFNVEFGGIYRVRYARQGKKQDGEPYAVVCMVENENQPEELEQKSNAKSQVKIWLDRLPDGVTDGSVIKLNRFAGFNWKHQRSEMYGKVIYQDVIELVDADIEKAEWVE